MRPIRGEVVLIYGGVIRNGEGCTSKAPVGRRGEKKVSPFFSPFNQRLRLFLRKNFALGFGG
ncbi:MAG: hypothetical protein CSA97_05525, partial [Bacteroidetes bacterium]